MVRQAGWQASWVAAGNTMIAPRDTRTRQDGAAGFSLLEVLVALAVLGLLVVGLVQGSRFALFARDAHARLLERDADLDGVDRTLRRLIEQARPGSKWEALVFAGTARAVTFTSVLPMPMATLPTRRADVELTVDGEHRLILVWTPHLHAIRIGRPPRPLTTELLEGVGQLDLSYWPAQSGNWTPVWHDSQPPRLVRIRIVFKDAGRPSWPDILAAPMFGPPPRP